MYDLSKERILAVDDEGDNLQVLQATLEMLHDAVVKTVLSADEGLDCLDSFHPTVILTDLSMPKADGYVFLYQIRQRPDTIRIPVIALTAHAMTGDRERIISAGFDGYISKPFDVMTLGDDLSLCLEQFHAQHPIQESTPPSVSIPPK